VLKGIDFYSFYNTDDVEKRQRIERDGCSLDGTMLLTYDFIYYFQYNILYILQYNMLQNKNTIHL